MNHPFIYSQSTVMNDWWGLKRPCLDLRLANSSSYDNTFATMTEPSVSRLRVLPQEEVNPWPLNHGTNRGSLQG